MLKQRRAISMPQVVMSSANLDAPIARGDIDQTITILHENEPRSIGTRSSNYDQKPGRHVELVQETGRLSAVGQTTTIMPKCNQVKHRSSTPRVATSVTHQYR